MNWAGGCCGVSRARGGASFESTGWDGFERLVVFCFWVLFAFNANLFLSRKFIWRLWPRVLAPNGTVWIKAAWEGLMLVRRRSIRRCLPLNHPGQESLVLESSLHALVLFYTAKVWLRRTTTADEYPEPIFMICSRVWSA